MNTPTLPVVEKAGLVAFFRDRVVICPSLNTAGKWVLPKGHQEYDKTTNEIEDPRLCALREFAEETGFKAELTNEEQIAETTLVIEEDGKEVLEVTKWFLGEVNGSSTTWDRGTLFAPPWQALELLSFRAHRQLVLEGLRIRAIEDYLKTLFIDDAPSEVKELEGEVVDD